MRALVLKAPEFWFESALENVSADVNSRFTTLFGDPVNAYIA